MNLSKSLKIAMAVHDVSNEVLAKGLQKHVSNINKWCRTEGLTLNSITIDEISEFFDMSVSEFIALGEDK